jgi:hypothetical protein
MHARVEGSRISSGFSRSKRASVATSPAITASTVDSNVVTGASIDFFSFGQLSKPNARAMTKCLPVDVCLESRSRPSGSQARNETGRRYDDAIYGSAQG